MVKITCYWCGDAQQWAAERLESFVVSCPKCDAKAWVSDHPDEGRLRLWEQIAGRGWRGPAPTPGALEREVEFVEDPQGPGGLPPMEAPTHQWRIIWARRRKATGPAGDYHDEGPDAR